MDDFDRAVADVHKRHLIAKVVHLMIGASILVVLLVTFLAGAEWGNRTGVEDEPRALRDGPEGNEL